MNSNQPLPQPGLIVLFGSGETSPTGRKIFESVFQALPHAPRLALLETPAGFELNSPQVIGRVGEFFSRRLQNHAPQVQVIPARKRGTPFSPDDPHIVSPLLDADLIFMGPGSPSYAIRQLRDSLAWYYLIARHRLGAVLALASAATVAFSSFALPVYEIYKVGEELHWIEGLDFFKLYGLQLVFIPHWNNQEGGAELDTSRCFMGQERFTRLMELLPDEITIVGVDEKTVLIMDPANSQCRVSGLGSITLIHTGHMHHKSWQENRPPRSQTANLDNDENLVNVTKQRNGHLHRYHDGEGFPMSEIGPFHVFQPEASMPMEIWQKALEINFKTPSSDDESPPPQVIQLIKARQKYRQEQDWEMADELRRQVASLGWEIIDTENGPVSRKLQE
jgi:cyanophycinase-like exopeptidase